ncbi:ABC transporter ATP-binding protein [Angelakisella massiliensis]|uniref:ABC transporter ATP-binding protein n=1 Tax=Angelakisella massiliensis TaxID=1871018 RepID=UPI0008F95ADA|nr:dipeptide ABC transporter ATP-binding protein [Angelakisella massiliensis]
MNRDIILSVSGLKKYFPVRRGLILQKTVGQVKAVDDVSFQVYRGETLGIIGESGCGKTTLARMIMGLEKQTEGEITFLGKKIDTEMPADLRKKIQMVFQDPYSSLDPRMNIRRIIEEPLRVHTKLSANEKRQILLPLLKNVGIDENALQKYPHEFSGGQRQRIGIARALILQPELLLCDEPVSALDVSIQAQILNLFKDLEETYHLTMIFVSHDMSVIRHISDRIIVMYLGQIMEIAPKKELFDHTLHPYSQALMSAIPVADPERQRARIPLKGEIPSPLNAPPGCPFSGRCAKAKEICHCQKPGLRHTSAQHYVACHLFAEGCEETL